MNFLIAERLAAKDPDNAAWLRDLAVSHCTQYVAAGLPKATVHQQFAYFPQCRQRRRDRVDFHRAQAPNRQSWLGATSCASRLCSA